MSRASLEQERNASLLAWYAASGRTLPWRSTTDPYPILVSEVMAQQTQVGRVADRFDDFMARFPTIEALAAAPLKDVIGAWSGLGYNTRAERLHRAAQRIADSGWPTDVPGLEELPGIGPYTARAVAALSFGTRVAAVDTNLRRVLSRWHGEPLDGPALDHAAATDIAEDAAAWNQAMMDLGALVCRPRRPLCDECPVEAWCAGPDVYQSPRPQSRFEGSRRQVRGEIVRTLVRAPATLDQLVAWSGVPHGTIEEALEHLTADGLVERHDGWYRLPE